MLSRKYWGIDMYKLLAICKTLWNRRRLILSIKLRLIEKYQKDRQAVMVGWCVLKLCLGEKVDSERQQNGSKIIVYTWSIRMQINKSKRWNLNFLNQLFSIFAVKSSWSWPKHSIRLEWLQSLITLVNNKAKYKNKRSLMQ